MIVILSGIMCSVLMLKLRGFKASFNLLSGKKHGEDKYDKSCDIPVLGAYRMNRDEYYVAHNISNNTPRKLTPKMTNSNQTKHRMKPSKSTGDLLSVGDLPQNTRKSTSDIPSDRERKHSRDTRTVNRDQGEPETQKLPEQRKREKPSRKQENQKKSTREHHEQPTQDRTRKEKKKGRAPKPPINTPPQAPQYSSNTLESSISRSSGPPPYSAEVVPNQNDNTGNTSFSKPVEESSWDLVSQHREQLNRPLKTSTTMPKSRVLDLHYRTGDTQTSVEIKDNSEV